MMATRLLGRIFVAGAALAATGMPLSAEPVAKPHCETEQSGIRVPTRRIGAHVFPQRPLRSGAEVCPKPTLPPKGYFPPFLPRHVIIGSRRAERLENERLRLENERVRLEIAELKELRIKREKQRAAEKAAEEERLAEKRAAEQALAKAAKEKRDGEARQRTRDAHTLIDQFIAQQRTSRR